LQPYQLAIDRNLSILEIPNRKNQYHHHEVPKLQTATGEPIIIFKILLLLHSNKLHANSSIAYSSFINLCYENPSLAKMLMNYFFQG